MIKRHNREMHPEKWSEYQQLSSADKKRFFESQVSSKISLSMIANSSIKCRQFQIDKDIVEKIMDNLLPGTSTVESDFSIIGWEKDECWTQLSNLSLEGILHAKQFDEMQRMKQHMDLLEAN